MLKSVTAAPAMQRADRLTKVNTSSRVARMGHLMCVAWAQRVGVA